MLYLVQERMSIESRVVNDVGVGFEVWSHR